MIKPVRPAEPNQIEGIVSRDHIAEEEGEEEAICESISMKRGLTTRSGDHGVGKTQPMKELRIVCDRPLGPGICRFIEIEDESGKSVNVGEWWERKDGLWELVIIVDTIRGAKPERVCHWVFEAAGLDPEDEFHDLYPGSGAVTAAWVSWKALRAETEADVALGA